MHSILLACSAVTDLLVGIVAQPAFITLEIIVMVRGLSSFSCKLDSIMQLAILALCLLSRLHLALLSVEIFLAICGNRDQIPFNCSSWVLLANYNIVLRRKNI